MPLPPPGARGEVMGIRYHLDHSVRPPLEARRSASIGGPFGVCRFPIWGPWQSDGVYDADPA